MLSAALKKKKRTILSINEKDLDQTAIININNDHMIITGLIQDRPIAYPACTGGVIWISVN